MSGLRNAPYKITSQQPTTTTIQPMTNIKGLVENLNIKEKTKYTIIAHDMSSTLELINKTIEADEVKHCEFKVLCFHRFV